MPSPRWGPCSRAWFSALSLLCAWPVNPWCVAVFALCPLCHWLPACSVHSPRLHMEAHHPGAPGTEFWRLFARCICCLLCSWFAPHFLPFLFGAPRHMSRGDELRQLAAQLSVLAALEASIALGLSGVMGPAGPGRAAAPPDAGSHSAPAANAASAAPLVMPSPSHEVAASLLRSASLRAASPRTRTRSRSPAPLPKRAPRRSSSVASGLRGSVALAESGLVTGLATKSCPPVPPPQLRLSRVSRALHAASVGSQPSVDASGPSAPSAPASEAPRATESASNSDDEWDALLDAHGLAPSLGGRRAPPSPSRPTALVLVGVLATSVAAVSAKLPSAPCGGTFDLFPPLSCALPSAAASLLEGLLWVRAHFRGSCGSAGRHGPLLRLLSSTWALSCVVDVGTGMAHRSATLKMRRSPTSAILIPGNGSARQRSSCWSPSLWRRVFTRAGLPALGRHPFVHGYEVCRWCHDEAH